MENGKLKVKSRVELKVNGKEQSNIKEFDFSGLEPNTYDCQVEMANGKPVRIVIEGKDVPKNEQKVQQLDEERKNREAKQAKQKEEELLKRKEEQFNQNRNQSNTNSQMSDSYNLQKAQVPSDTRVNGDPSVIENFALKFYKFARFDFKDDKEQEKHFKFFNSKAITRRDKSVIVPALEIKPDFSKINFTVLSNREKHNAEQLLNQNVKSQIFKPSWRLVIGLGEVSVYETGMTLHHIYGFPYIPASAVKGILRNYIISEVDKYQNNEGLAIKDEEFCKIFGCPASIMVEKDGKKKTYNSHNKEAQQGKTIFFDAFPTETPKLKPDIMNVHYKDWYGGEGSAPTDTQQTNPILFLTVKEDTPFQFMIGSKNNVHLSFKDKPLMSWLSSALEDKGIGAKTAVGYGYMH